MTKHISNTEAVKISVVIITYNEEKNIRKCLGSVMRVADEIVVVDSFSTDDTEKICSEYNVVFIQNEFIGHIQQKSFAITQAKYDYILSLDADEVLSGKLEESVSQAKENWKYDAYYLFRMSHYCGKFIRFGDWYPDKKIRLFKKSSGQWGGINPHDTFHVKSKKKVGKLKGNLLHYTFNSVQEHIAQANKFSSIGAEQLAISGVHVWLVKLLFHPLWRFIRSYFLRLGFLDGMRGLAIALIISFETYLKYLKVYWYGTKHPFHDTNILIISSQKTWRGGEQQVAYLVEGLRKSGVNVHMAIERNSKLREFAVLNKFPHTIIKFWNGYGLLSALKLKRISKRLRIDLIHIQCSPSHTLCAVSSLLGNNTPLILSRRVDFSIKPNFFSRWKYNLKIIKRILCVSDKIKSIISPEIKRPAQISTVYSGIDTTKFKLGGQDILRNEYKLSKESIIIGNVSAIANHKDYFTFVDTAEILLNKGLDATFFIIGDDGGEQKLIEAYILRKGLEENIILTGFRTDIVNILPHLDILLFTSKEEGLGTTILDAMACDVPVVATAAGGIPEMITHGENGMLANIKDSIQLANYIMSVLHDQQLKSKIIEGGQKTVKLFSKDRMSTKTLEIYKEVMATNAC